MDDDWDTPAPNYRPFYLIKDVSPEQEANKEGFVDLTIYGHWKKAERRLYQKLKARKLSQKIQQEGIKQVSVLTQLLEGIKLYNTDEETDPEMKDLISEIESMRLNSKNSSKEKRG